MKIEKLTEDKIRVIINSSELSMPYNNNIILNSIESQKLFLDNLKKAEKEVDFLQMVINCLLKHFQL